MVDEDTGDFDAYDRPQAAHQDTNARLSVEDNHLAKDVTVVKSELDQLAHFGGALGAHEDECH